MGQEVICTAYGNFILKDTDLTQWYCTHTNTSGGMNVHFGDTCKPLPVSTI